MVSPRMPTIVFTLFFLRLHLILSRTQKSGFNFSLAFSQSNTTVVPLLVSAILALMKPYLLAPTARLTNTKLMGRHHKPTSSISPLSPDYMQWFPTHLMQRRCNTAQSTNMTLQRSQTFLMALITAHCLGLLSLLVMKKFQCGSSLVFKSPVRSGFLTPRGLDRDQDRSIKFPGPQKTGLDRFRPVCNWSFAIFASVKK